MVVDSYAKIGDAASAEAVALRMEPLRWDGNEELRANTVMYTYFYYRCLVQERRKGGS